MKSGYKTIYVYTMEMGVYKEGSRSFNIFSSYRTEKIENVYRTHQTIKSGEIRENNSAI